MPRKLKYSDDELSPHGSDFEEDYYTPVMEPVYNTEVFHFTNLDYGSSPYARALERLSVLAKRQIKLAHRPPAIPEKYKPQQPEMVGPFLRSARQSVYAMRKYDGFTCYIKKESGPDPMARVECRSGNYYSFLIPIPLHLHALFSDLDMTLVGELVGVEDREEITELGFEAVLKVLKMCLSRAPLPGEPRIRIVLFDIHTMGGLNRSAFHMHVPMILKAIVIPTSHLMRVAHLEHFRVWKNDCFVPEGKDLSESMSGEGLERYLLDKSDAHGWEGYVISCPFALERTSKAFDADWSGTARDRSTVKCKKVPTLGVAGAIFRIWREAQERTDHYQASPAGLYNVYVFYALHAGGQYRYLTDIWSDDYMKVGSGFRSVVKNLSVPEVFCRKVSLKEARRDLFVSAFRTREQLEDCTAGFTTELRMTWVHADEDERYRLSGLKQIKHAWPGVDRARITEIQTALRSNKHWVAINQRRAQVASLDNYSVGKAELRVLDTKGWDKPLPKKPSGRDARVSSLLEELYREPLRPVSTQPVPAPPPEQPVPMPPPNQQPVPMPPPNEQPKQEAPSVLGKRALERPIRQLRKSLGVEDVVRAIYRVVFHICGVVARGGTMPELVHGCVKIVVGRMNQVFNRRSAEADAMLPYLAWDRFITRRPDTGFYTAVPGTPELTRDEPARILRSMFAPDVIRRMDSAGLHSVSGLHAIYDEFKSRDMPGVVESEEYKNMEAGMLLASV